MLQIEYFSQFLLLFSLLFFALNLFRSFFNGGFAIMEAAVVVSISRAPFWHQGDMQMCTSEWLIETNSIAEEK